MQSTRAVGLALLAGGWCVGYDCVCACCGHVTRVHSRGHFVLPHCAKRDPTVHRVLLSSVIGRSYTQRSSHVRKTVREQTLWDSVKSCE